MRELQERTDDTQTKAAIRQKALKLFLQNGFQATTLEEIAQAVALPTSALLNLYCSKTDIVMQDDLDPWWSLHSRHNHPEAVRWLRFATRFGASCQK